MLVASAVFALGSGAIAPLAGWSLWTALAMAFGGAFALQCGYLAGLMLVCAATRARLWPRMLRRLVVGYASAVFGTRARAR
jgi:hypothetical protein